MAEQTALLRQWLVLKTLSARRLGLSLKELAAEMQVSERTIRRDLETFLAAGFPLTETTLQFGRKKWHLDADKL
jgi:predicted DNA-binding transcriptional regulator YafY